MTRETNLASIMAEVTSFANSVSPTIKEASASNTDLASVLDKLAMELDAGVTENTSSKEANNKENSMNEAQIVDKIANAVLAKLEKIAVDGSEVTPGMEQAQQGTSTAASGTIVNNLQSTNADNMVPGPAVGQVPAGESATDNPNDLVKGVTPGTGADPLQKGASVNISVQELDTLTKLATVGYEAIVEAEADSRVNQLIKEAQMQKQAQANLQYLANNGYY